jgi:hypothetical protein
MTKLTMTMGAAIVAAALALGGASAAQAATGPAAEVVAATNSLRVGLGLNQLRSDPTLDSVAQTWADNMAVNGLRHSDNTWRGNAIPAGWDWNGENIAAGYTTSAGVMAGWIGSPEHYANLVSPHYTRIGVGYNQAASMWVQVFAGYPSDRLDSAAWTNVSSSTLNPVSNLDSASVVGGNIHLTGWTFDPSTDASITETVYVNGAGTAHLADTARPDVNAAFGGSGAHGFDITVPPNGGGNQQVCLYSLNVGAGSNVLTGCVNLSVPSTAPIGTLDSAVASPGAITVSGWSIDPKTAASIAVHVYVDTAGIALTANSSRVDVGNAYPGYGNAHGYSATIPAGAGTHTVCAYGINSAAGGTNSLLGCKTVTVPGGAPIGSLDTATAGNGTITVTGWTLDPNTAATIPVDVYVGAVGGRYTAGLNRPDIAAAYPGYGALHGFSLTIAAPRGATTVCAYGIDQVGGNNNALIGCKAVTVN